MSTVAPIRRRAPAPRRSTRAAVITTRLGHYEDPQTGAVREIVRLPAAAGSRLLVDRIAGRFDDPRLIAHLAADEPPDNERRLCAMYLADRRRGTCRRVQPEDFGAPATDEPSCDPGGGSATNAPLVDAHGVAYTIGPVPSESGPELRWTRCRLPDGHAEPITLRQVVGHFENYEPMRAMTTRAITDKAFDPRASAVTLRGELERLNGSRIVLNRGLREAVVRIVGPGGLTLSDIAIRCGRVKRDTRGNVSGETSWLGRRIGQLPESGETAPRPWVHSDVLALIARDGLGVSPHDVEVP